MIPELGHAGRGEGGEAEGKDVARSIVVKAR